MSVATHRVGVIGSGGIAAQHVRGYRKAEADIVALCDVDPDRLAERCADWDVPTGYTDAAALLADPTIDAVSVCTPNASHHPITLAAAAAGKHVLCEKPVALDLAQGEEMIDACARAGVVLQVGHHLRSSAAGVLAKEMIERGDLGELTFLRFRQAHDWGGAGVRGVFGSRAESGGGTLLDNGCHLFDLARHLGGDVADVFARIATLRYDVEVEDTATASLRFGSGALGEIEVAWTATGWQEAFWIYGTEGMIELDNVVAPNVLVHRWRKEPSPNWIATEENRHELRGLDAHRRHVANFLAAIDGERDVVCTGRDGVEAVRLVLAAYQSADTGAPVAIAPTV